MISGFGVELLAIDAWEVGTILSGLQIQANTQLMMHLLFFYPTSQTKSSVDVLFRTIANTQGRTIILQNVEVPRSIFLKSSVCQSIPVSFG
jgi:hypothetical protein